jgi:azurin
MPHNFVIVRPGTRERVGSISETMKPDQFDSQGRAFVPNTRDVIAATKLLESGQRATLRRTAPSEEGVYEFVCTFPGHWQVMWGQFVVTKDVDAYLQKNPQAPAAVSSSHSHHFE